MQILPTTFYVGMALLLHFFPFYQQPLAVSTTYHVSSSRSCKTGGGSFSRFTAFKYGGCLWF